MRQCLLLPNVFPKTPILDLKRSVLSNTFNGRCHFLRAPVQSDVQVALLNTNARTEYDHDLGRPSRVVEHALSSWS